MYLPRSIEDLIVDDDDDDDDDDEEWEEEGEVYGNIPEVVMLCIITL
jgi:hypothetical protein